MNSKINGKRRVISFVLIISLWIGMFSGALVPISAKAANSEKTSLGESKILGESKRIDPQARQRMPESYSKAYSWEEVSSIIGRYYGEWTDESYQGAYSDGMPNTALLGNGDLGVASAGGKDEKTFLLSKSDFWSSGNMLGAFGSGDNATKPIAIGGVTLQKQKRPIDTDNPNLAPSHSTVIASSQHDNFSASRAVNGNPTTSGWEGWVSAANQSEYWLQVGFENPITIQHWIGRWDGFFRAGEDGNNTKECKLLYSNDGTHWTEADHVENNTENLVSRPLSSPITASYFRLEILQPVQGGTPRARVGQFELYAETMGEPLPEESDNLALNKNVKACEFISSQETPSHMLDGSYSTKWCTTTDHESPHWAIIDLEEPKEVASYALYNASYGGENAAYNTHTFHLQYLEDESGVDWATIEDETNWVDMEKVTENQEGVVRENLETPVTAQYVRLWIPQGARGNKSHVVRILELELFSDLLKEGFYEKQNILDAQIETQVTINDAALSAVTWMDANENYLITKLTSEDTEDVDLELRTWGKNDNPNYPATAAVEGNAVMATRSTYNNAKTNPDSWTSEVAMATKIVGPSSTAAVEDNAGVLSFTLASDETAYLVTAIAGGGQTYDHQDQLQQNDPKTKASALLGDIRDSEDIASRYAEHQSWWKDYWMASYIDLEDSESLMKYYYGAQYQLACTAREGKIAPGLYGVWHTTDNPLWSSDYHLNYNFIATFYGAGSSNRTDILIPAGEAMLSFMPEGTRRAADVNELKRINNDYVSGRPDLANGIQDALLYPVGIGPWGTVADDTYHNEALCASFSAYPLIQYYKYTLDEAYLEDSVYEYLKKCATFYETWLEEENGKYILYAGYNEGSWAINPAVELAALKNTLETLIHASEVLDKDADRRVKWQDMYDNLAPQPTSTWQGKEVHSLAEKEWRNGQWQDMANPVPGDGNIIPLESIVPGEQLGYYSSAEELEIARNTIDVFGDRAWGQINNFPKIFVNAIRSRYPAETLVAQLSRTIDRQIRPNLRIDDNVHGVEKIGATEAINNMLLTSHLGVLKAFPNWVSDKDASFGQLRAYDAFLVSGAYDGTAGEVEYVKVTSEQGKTLTIASPWEEGALVSTVDGQEVETVEGTAPNWDTEKTLTFDTEAGETYLLLKPKEKFSVTVVGGRASESMAAEGTVMTLTADAPQEGYAFERWTADTSVIFEDDTQPSTTFVMLDEPVTITAHYKLLPPEEYAITVVDGTANVTSAAEGTVITVTAHEKEGKVFERWSSPQVALQDETKERTTFVMPAKTVELVAHFVAAPVDPELPTDPEVPVEPKPPVEDSSSPPVKRPSRSKQGTVTSQADALRTAFKKDSQKAEITQSFAETILKKSILQAEKEGKSIVLLPFRNMKTISQQTLKNIAKQTDKALSIQADTLSRDGKFVLLRLSFDPAKADRDLSLTGSGDNKKAKQIESLFARWFTNDIQVMTFDQAEDFGQEVRVAMKLDEKLPEELVTLYQYNMEKNTYSELSSGSIRVDNNGYLHFNITTSDSIIVSNGPFESK